ncbi:MAG: hypothetical protein JO224_06335 [Pelomonas sp.]|nr:hypothetical protein [Roseateles sp.]
MLLRWLQYKKQKGPARGPSSFSAGSRHRHQAAPSHIEVSNALHIIGMFTPKFGLLVALLLALFAAGLTAIGASS